jgi:hypothetical protein
MGGGDYKERVCLTATRCGDLDQNRPRPRPYLYLGHNPLVGTTRPLPGPITPPEPRLASAQLGLVSSSTALPLLRSPQQPGLSSFPVSVDSLPSTPPIDHPSTIDLEISRQIPSTRSPGHPSPRLSGEPNRPAAWLPAFPRRQRSPPPDLRSRLNLALSHLFFYYCILPLPAPRVPKDRARANSPPPNKTRFVSIPQSRLTASPHFW